MMRRDRPETALPILDEIREAGVPQRERAEETRQRAIQATARQIRAVPAQRSEQARARRLVACAAAALALAASALVFARIRSARGTPDEKGPSVIAQRAEGVGVNVTSGALVETHRGRAAVVAAGTRGRVFEGDDLDTAADGLATIELPRGVQMNLGPATIAHLEVANETEQRLRLDLGRTDVSVPKPGGPRTVEVTTPDARVVVHGTIFAVQVDRVDPQTTRTTVSVTRGSVLVVHDGDQHLVAAGSHWSSSAAREPAGAVAPEAQAREQEPAGDEGTSTARATRAIGRRNSSGTHPQPGGSLREQNRLFHAAAIARKDGRDAAALAYLDELLARFPGTALEPEVRLARLRTLERLGRGKEASREAESYLSRYPQAPARDEARRILLRNGSRTPSPAPAAP